MRLSDVEKALGRMWGGSPRLELLEELPVYESSRAAVVRCAITGQPEDAPGTIVVRRALGDHQEMFHEWGALAFLDSLEMREAVAPRFIVGEAESGWMAVEDLGEETGRRLGLILFGEDRSQAVEALLAHQRALARLHAATVGKGSGYRSMRAKLPGADSRSRHRIHEIPEALDGFAGLLAEVGLAVPAALAEEIAGAKRVIEEAGPFEVLTHGDPTPANAFFENGEVRFFDFETCAFRHALLDGAFADIRYLHSVWAHAIPRALRRRMRATYRDELARGCEGALDDEPFEDALVACAAGWMAGLCRLAPSLTDTSEEKRWGRVSNRQRLLSGLDHFVDLAGELDRLPVVAATAAELGELLHQRWADGSAASAEMPVYPALR